MPNKPHVPSTLSSRVSPSAQAEHIKIAIETFMTSCEDEVVIHDGDYRPCTPSCPCLAINDVGQRLKNYHHHHHHNNPPTTTNNNHNNNNYDNDSNTNRVIVNDSSDHPIMRQLCVSQKQSSISLRSPYDSFTRNATMSNFSSGSRTCCDAMLQYPENSSLQTSERCNSIFWHLVTQCTIDTCHDLSQTPSTPWISLPRGDDYSLEKCDSFHYVDMHRTSDNRSHAGQPRCIESANVLYTSLVSPTISSKSSLSSRSSSSSSRSSSDLHHCSVTQSYDEPAAASLALAPAKVSSTCHAASELPMPPLCFSTHNISDCQHRPTSYRRHDVEAADHVLQDSSTAGCTLPLVSCAATHATAALTDVKVAREADSTIAADSAESAAAAADPVRSSGESHETQRAAGPRTIYMSSAVASDRERVAPRSSSSAVELRIVRRGAVPHSIRRRRRSGGDRNMINDYRIVRELGRGSYAKVMLVKDVRDDNLYAMKVLRYADCRESRSSDGHNGSDRGSRSDAVTVMWSSTAAAGSHDTPNNDNDDNSNNNISSGGGDILLRTKERRRLSAEREIHNARHLQGTHMVQTHEIITSGGSSRGNDKRGKIYLILQYMSGGPISRRGPDGCLRAVPEWTLRRQAHQILCAMRYLQCHGIIHRDIKPDNILLDAEGNAYLSDFGHSAPYNSAGEVVGVEGTPAYMAPELCRCDRLVLGSAVDVWALGVTLYELMYAVHPFFAHTCSGYRANIIEKPLVFPDEAMDDATGVGGGGGDGVDDDNCGSGDAASCGGASKAVIRSSPEFKEMIRGMLEKDSAQRWTVNEALGCDWFRLLRASDGSAHCSGPKNPNMWCIGHTYQQESAEDAMQGEDSLLLDCDD